MMEQALIKIAEGLQTKRWILYSNNPLQDLQTNGELPMHRQVSVIGDLMGHQIKDYIHATLGIKFISEDGGVTNYIEYHVSGEIKIEGGDVMDVTEKVIFPSELTEQDAKNEKRLLEIAISINEDVSALMQKNFEQYLFDNEQAIEDAYKKNQDGNKRG